MYLDEIKSYSWAPPRFNFLRPYPLNWDEPEPGETFTGLELEVTTPYEMRAADVVYRCMNHGEIGYVKHDSSVYGVEIVTHPMSLGFAQQFKWADMLDKLMSKACANIDPQDNGLHVHVNRTAFRSPAHTYAWLRMLYRNHAHVIVLGGRETEWGCFQHTTHGDHAVHARCHKPGKGYDGDLRYKLARAEKYDGTLSNRYNAVNTLNSDTFEVRCMAATLDPLVLLARVEFIHATVEYTRNFHGGNDTTNAWKWETFYKWAKDQGDTYINLITQFEIIKTRRLYQMNYATGNLRDHGGW